MNKNELHEIGKQSISRFKDMELINPRYAVELELDFWEQEIFPLCQQYGVPKYQFVLEEILMKVGFVNLTVDKLYDTVRRVRSKRTKADVTSGIPHPPEQASKPITSPIDTTSLVGVSQPRAVPGGASPMVEVDWKWAEELKRLNAGGDDWTEQDEKIWAYVMQICAENNINIKTEFWKFNKIIESGTIKRVIGEIRSKRENVGFEL
ncbi:hypothetical protein [Burkholderia multivorans]|uniref:hypothetical protein n=1 Tax=Burkholderia multivorans TaxID=87883 RepID=UPI0021BF43E1|nr:hypothetical protein [Burkholderia multivorans]